MTDKSKREERELVRVERKSAKGLEIFSGEWPDGGDCYETAAELVMIEAEMADKLLAFDLQITVPDGLYSPEDLRDAQRALQRLLGCRASRIALVPLCGHFSAADPCSVH